jgi:Ca-activated chloride channel family protein
MTTLPLISEADLANLIQSNANGFGSLYGSQGHLPLKALTVDASIDGLIAHTRIQQTFVNTLGHVIEATYIFPLPDRAAVTRFQMVVNDRVVEGVIKERSEARQAYAQAIQTGYRAAITEEDRSGVFTLQVGNILPNETVTIYLDLVGSLPFEGSEVTYRFPLVVAPRYIPGSPLPGAQAGSGVSSDTDAVPDASRISPPRLLPGYPNPVQLEIRIKLNTAGLPVSHLRSSLHTVMEQKQDKQLEIILGAGDRLNRDFILRWQLGDPKEISSRLVICPDHAEATVGSFLLTLIPPSQMPDSQRPRDVVFLLDRSGSMAGWKIVAARRAAARMIDTLTDQDQFKMIAFDSRLDYPPGQELKGLLRATDQHRFQAVSFLGNLQARGGTEMLQPLMDAADLLAKSSVDRDRILVLVTDGQVGNEDQILKVLSPKLTNIRIFAVGIDQAVNAGFLNRLAISGRGQAECVESEDRLDEVMTKLHRLMSVPLLTNIQLVEPTVGSIEGSSLVPKRLPDLFWGSSVFISGRYQGQIQSLKVASQNTQGKTRVETVMAELGDPAIASIWARGQVRELEDLYLSSGSNQVQLERQIIQTSLQFQVLSRFTAFLAIDNSQMVNPRGQLHPIVQPVETPEGWVPEIQARLSWSAPSAAPTLVADRLEPGLSNTTPPGDAPWTMAEPLIMQSPPPQARKRQQEAQEAKLSSKLDVETPGSFTEPPLPKVEALQDLQQDPDPMKELQTWLDQLNQTLNPDGNIQDRLQCLRSLRDKLTTILEKQTVVLALRESLQKLLTALNNQAIENLSGSESLILWQQAKDTLKAVFAGGSTPGQSSQGSQRNQFWK